MKSNPLKCIILSCLLLVVSCAPTSLRLNENDKSVENPYALAPKTYLEQAKLTQGKEQQQLLLNAAGRLINDGLQLRAQQILRKLPDSQLSPDLIAQKKILSARLALSKHQAKRALSLLSKVDRREDLDAYQNIAYHQTLALAYEQNNKTINSIEERMELEELLPNQSSRVDNRRELWRSLASLPQPTLASLNIEANDDVLSAWLELALIPKQYRHNPQQMFQALSTWQKKYPQHPGQTMLPASLSQAAKALLPRPTQIAVLLPLSGPWSAPGRATQDGIMDAYYRALENHSTLAKIKLYDTNQSDVKALYSKAINQGADFVIGPLLKPNVEAIASISHPVPTLALNRAQPSYFSNNRNFYQFALSPVDEATQVAQKAFNDGHRNTLIIAPKGSWGESIANAYQKETQKLGGKVIGHYYYTKKDALNTNIKSILGIEDSEQRKRSMTRLLGKKIKFFPRLRQDIDAIFLVALPSDARQIRPLLKFYYAGDIPIYGTSSVYAGIAAPRSDSDLNGVFFVDMPYLFKNHKRDNKPSAPWPEQMNSYERLYALGLDAFSLTYLINQLTLLPEFGVMDATGVLFLNSENQIMRELQWAKFEGGVPQRLLQRKALP